MPDSYVVQDNDCLSSIAHRRGFSWQTLWDAPDNADLKNLRKDPNVLCAGDVVVIPDKVLKKVDAAVENRHRFKRKGIPAKLHLRFLDAAGKPRKNLPYKLKVDGVLSSGETSGEGRVDVSIPPDAQCAQFTLTDSAGKVLDLYEFTLGQLNPVTTVSGLQQRLVNLGFNCRPVDGTFSPATRAAMNCFQRSMKLAETAAPDDATRQKLLERHGS